MSTHSIALPRNRWRTLRATAPPLLLGLILLGWVFRQEVAAAVAVWSVSTAYNHCFLVLPIALWLAYDRRDKLPGVPVRPMPWVVLLAAPAGAVWLLSERLGIMEGRQLAALACVEILFLAALGWRMFRALAAPLFYLVFLVPFGAFLTSPLQDFTAHFIVGGLDLMGIPNYADAHTIEIPEGTFFVAEACAGLRFLIAAVAFGVLYAFTMYRSPVRRLLFVAASTAVPVVANGVRALGIVVAGHWIGSAQAAAADHLIYGWIFFSAVIMLLIAAGLPFRQDGRREPAAAAVQPPIRAAHSIVLAAAVAFMAAIGPLVARGLDRVAAAGPVSPPVALAGCVPAADMAIDADNRAMLSRIGAVAQPFVCGDKAMRLLAVAFPPRTNPSLLLATQRSLTGQGAEDVEVAPLPSAGAPGWQSVSTTKPPLLTATALWIDGASASGGLQSRLRQARNSVFGTGHVAVLAVAGVPGQGPVAGPLREANAAGLSADLAAFTGVAR